MLRLNVFRHNSHLYDVKMLTRFIRLEFPVLCLLNLTKLIDSIDSSPILGTLSPLEKATQENNEMSNSAEEIRNYRLNADELFGFCISAISSLDAIISESNSDTGRIHAGFKGGLFGVSLGFDLEINPISRDESSLSFQCFPLAATGNRAIFGGGKEARKKADEFFAEIERIIRRASIKRGIA